MKILRTPDPCFADLPDPPFAPHDANAGDLRVHAVDEGPRDAAPVVGEELARAVVDFIERTH